MYTKPSLFMEFFTTLFCSCQEEAGSVEEVGSAVNQALPSGKELLLMCRAQQENCQLFTLESLPFCATMGGRMERWS